MPIVPCVGGSQRFALAFVLRLQNEEDLAIVVGRQVKEVHSSFHTVIFALGMLPLTVKLCDLHSIRMGGSSQPRSNRCPLLNEPTPSSTEKLGISFHVSAPK